MCQCGCGEFPITKAFKLPSGDVIGLGIYRGCSDCFAGPGANFYVFPSAESEWLQGAETESYKPDEFGGNNGNGIPVSFFEMHDLIEAAKEIGGTDDVSVEEWLEENGLDMMQNAMRRFDERVAKAKGE